MRSFTILLALAVALNAYAQVLEERQDTAFTVTSPQAGDTVSLVSSTSKDLTVNIAWTVPQVMQSRPVFITVMQGDSVSALSDVLAIDSGATNNGTYSWTSDNYQMGLVAGYSYALPSGCNYTVALKVWTDIAYSGYFTVINPEDGGLSTSAVCPTPGTGPSGPAPSGSGTSLSASPTSAVASTTASSESSTSSSNTRTTTSSATSSRTSSAATSSSAASRTSTNIAAGQTGSPSSTPTPTAGASSSSGISTTTLAVAVAVPVVVLLLLFAFIIWFGRRRGWFIKRSHLQDYTAASAFTDRQPYLEKPGAGAGINGAATPLSRKPVGSATVTETNGPAEMQGEQPYRIDGQEVHQMPGDEERGKYFVRN